MSATAEEVRDILKSIDAGIRALVAHFGAGAKPVAAAASHSTEAIAPDRDLDGKYGDPEIRMVDPRDWTGDSMKGRRFSECPPEYLEMIADRWDYFVEQAEEALPTETDADEAKKLKDKIKYQTKDAARARGWAKRLRGGWVAPEPEPIAAPPGSATGEPLTDDSIPFLWLIGAIGLAHSVLGLWS